ncbi:MAG: EscU/YscU/HrcU family type III secretion system export apparatus switch protein, partial [Bacillota bacterium]
MPKDNPTGQKTEDPTPKRKREAREEGQVAKSQELASAFVLMGGFVILYLGFSRIIGLMMQNMTEFLSMNRVPSVDKASTYEMVIDGFLEIALIVGPVMMAAAIVGGIVNFIQVGPLFTIKPLQPKLSNINPVSGLKRLFSIKSLVELAKSLAKLAIIVFLSFMPLRYGWTELVQLPHRGVEAGVVYIGNLIFKIAVRISIFLVVVGLFDYFYQLWDHK